MQNPRLPIYASVLTNESPVSEIPIQRTVSPIMSKQSTTPIISYVPFYPKNLNEVSNTVKIIVLVLVGLLIVWEVLLLLLNITGILFIFKRVSFVYILIFTYILISFICKLWAIIMAVLLALNVTISMFIIYFSIHKY